MDENEKSPSGDEAKGATEIAQDPTISSEEVILEDEDGDEDADPEECLFVLCEQAIKNPADFNAATFKQTLTALGCSWIWEEAQVFVDETSIEVEGDEDVEGDNDEIDDDILLGI